MTPQFQPERYAGVANATRVRVPRGKAFLTCTDMHTRDGGGDGSKNDDREMMCWLERRVHAGCRSLAGHYEPP